MHGCSLRGARVGVGTGILAAALGALTIFGGGAVAHAAGATWAVQKSPNATLTGGQLESVSCSSPSACTAAGKDLNASGITVTLAERWDGSSWERQPTPNPPGDSAASVPELLGVSCPTSDFCEAVGDYQQPFASVSIAETWNGSEWTMQSFPVPANSDGAGLAQVSCTSAMFCEAVGSYFDESDGQTDPLAAAWNGTSWTIQATPSLTTTAAFTAVSCTSARFCEAWGGGNAGNPGPEVAEQWNGTSWALQTVPSDAVSVASVSCTSARFCEAVGTTAAYDWNGSQWSAQTVPSSLSAAALNGVSCSSARFCELVGDENAGGDDDAGVAAVWNGKAWTAQSSPNPSGVMWVNLNAVSCASAQSCEADGYSEIQVTDNAPKALAESWNGTSWALQHAAAPAGATTNELTGVSCFTASFCAAVGGHGNSAGNGVNLAEIWNGTSWRITATPNLKGQSGAADNDLYSVSCVSASFCQAVGSGPSGPEAALWNGTSWTVQAIPGADVQTQEVSCATADFCMVAGGTDDVDIWNGSSWGVGSSVPGFSNLSSVSCISASFCEAVGYDPSGGNAAAWNGTSWTVQATPGPASNSFNAVSCTAVSACEAVGQALGTNDEPVPLAEAWNGTSWTIQSAADPANSQSGSLASVSCTSVGSCTAVGQYASGTPPNFGEPQTLAEVWDGTTWTIPATPDPSSAAQNILSSVSCGATAACTAAGLYSDLGGVPATLIEAGD